MNSGYNISILSQSSEVKEDKEAGNKILIEFIKLLTQLNNRITKLKINTNAFSCIYSTEAPKAKVGRKPSKKKVDKIDEVETINSSHIKNMLSKILSVSNEIMLDKDYLRKLILNQLEIPEEFFSELINTFVVNNYNDSFLNSISKVFSLYENKIISTYKNMDSLISMLMSKLLNDNNCTIGILNVLEQIFNNYLVNSISNKSKIFQENLISLVRYINLD